MKTFDEAGFGIHLEQFGQSEPFVTWDLVRDVEGALELK
jgi:hypothetical protein